jgi:2-haloacid dehalogenase
MWQRPRGSVEVPDEGNYACMTAGGRGTVAFDVIGTLFTLERPRGALTALGLPDHAVEVWFAESLRDFFALSHAGGYSPLRDALAAALPRVLASLDVEYDDAVIEGVMTTLRDLDPAPGAGTSIEALTEDGFRILALTNGSEELTRRLLEGAGLHHDFEALLSCDAIRTSKPHPAVYEMARQREPGELWMVAAHAWDISGAARAGLRTAWISGKERVYPAIFPTPDIQAPDLDSAARRIIAHPPF